MKYRCPVCPPSESSTLHPCTIGYQCRLCHAVYPVVDDTIILVPNHETWFASQGNMMLLRKDLSSDRYDFFLGLSSPLRAAQKQLYSYLNAPKGSLHTWLENHLHHQSGTIVDMGCGIGLHKRCDVIGVDANWTLLSHYPGKKIIADISNPPFFAESIDCILLLNVLDSHPSPWLLLQQIDALLSSKGRVLFSSPFSWNDDITPPKEQCTPQQVQQFFIQRGYHIDEEEHTWFVQSNPRSRTQYSVMAWDIKKI